METATRSAASETAAITRPSPETDTLLKVKPLEAATGFQLAPASVLRNRPGWPLAGAIAASRVAPSAPPMARSRQLGAATGDQVRATCSVALALLLTPDCITVTTMPVAEPLPV